MFSFILGAVTGGLAAWWWRGDIQKYVEQKLPNVREKAAERLTAIEQKAEEALGKAREQIDRIRTGSDSSTHDKREVPSSPRSPGNFTQGTGV